MRRAGIKKIANQWSAALRVQISASASLMCRQGLMLRAPACISPPLGWALPDSLATVPRGSPGSPPSPKSGLALVVCLLSGDRTSLSGKKPREPRNGAGESAACGTPGSGTLRGSLRSPRPFALPRTRWTSRQGSLRKLSQNRLNCN